MTKDTTPQEDKCICCTDNWQDCKCVEDKSIESVIAEFDKEFKVGTHWCDGRATRQCFTGCDGTQDECQTSVKAIKAFIRTKLTEQKQHYEKELKIADDRWKGNEKYRDDYLNACAENELLLEQKLTEQKKELIEQIKEGWKDAGAEDYYGDLIEGNFNNFISQLK